MSGMSEDWPVRSPGAGMGSSGMALCPPGCAEGGSAAFHKIFMEDCGIFWYDKDEYKKCRG